MAAIHLPDQALSHGATATNMEFWIERLVQLMKRTVKYRSTSFPELLFVNTWRLTQALLRMRQKFPMQCKTFDEWVPLYSNRVLSAPRYDDAPRPANGAQFIGAGKEPTQSQYVAGLILLNNVINNAPDEWYTEAGWDKADKGARFLGTGFYAKMLIFAKAITPSNDLITSVLCNSQFRKDNTWAFVRFTLAGGEVQLCIARMLYFVLAIYEKDTSLFKDDGIKPETLRMVVADLWECEVVLGKALVVAFDEVTNEMPDMFKVTNLSKDNDNKHDRTRHGSYFGQVMINVLEFGSQVVPTLPLNGSSTRFFCTASKASGR